MSPTRSGHVRGSSSAALVGEEAEAEAALLPFGALLLLLPSLAAALGSEEDAAVADSGGGMVFFPVVIVSKQHKPAEYRLRNRKHRGGTVGAAIGSGLPSKEVPLPPSSKHGDGKGRLPGNGWAKTISRSSPRGGCGTTLLYPPPNAACLRRSTLSVGRVAFESSAAASLLAAEVSVCAAPGISTS
jgi:hypothetical protein